jgi:type VI protein secretion system component VasF
MRHNALNLVAAVLLFPAFLALFFAWKAREQVDYDLALVVWVWFGLPGMALSALLFWLGRSNRLQRDDDQLSSSG